MGLSQETFKNGDNGYLVEDCCIFGAELFIIAPTSKLGQLSMIKHPSGGTITWKIENFSLLHQICYYSPVKSVEGEGTHLSLYLELAEPDKLAPNREFYVKYNLRLRDQIKSNHSESETPIEKCFDSSTPSWGYLKFVRLKYLNDLSKGYMVKDAELLVISTVK
ncbi:hypothetical protein GQ457_02G028730 [Hibiscus cannabinus]